MSIKMNFILISDQLQQFHILCGNPKLTVNKLFFWPFIFFDAEIKRKRTERRQRQNASIPESKALFLVYKDE